MQHKILFGRAALVLAVGLTSPAFATVHHHRLHHRTMHQTSQSTPAERQQTAELNRQQLTQAQAGNAGSGGMAQTSAPQQNSLTTEPANYRRPGTTGYGTGGTGNTTTGTMGSAPSADTGATQTPGSATPPGAVPQSNPGGTTTPPPANPSGGTQ